MKILRKYLFVIIIISFSLVVLYANGVHSQKDSIQNLQSNVIVDTDSFQSPQSYISVKTDSTPNNIIYPNAIEILNKINTNIMKIIPNKFLGIPTSIITTALLTLIFTLISVYLAYYLSTIKKRKNVTILFRFMIRILIKSAKKQSDNFNELVKLLNKKKTYDVYNLTSICDFNLNSINRLPLDVLIENITKDKSKAETLSKFLTSLNILDTISTSYKFDLDKMVNNFNRYLKSWNYNIEKIREGFDGYVAYFASQGGYKRGIDPFFDDFDKIYSNFQKQVNYLDYYIMIDYLLNPLHSLCKKNMSNITAVTLLNNILACKASFTDYLNTKKIYSEIFLNYINLTNESTTFIESNLDNLFKEK